MKRAPRSRRIEITLLLVGISLIGFSLGASFDRWRYQKEQSTLFSQVTRIDARDGASRPREAATRVESNPEDRRLSSADKPQSQMAAIAEEPGSSKVEKKKNADSAGAVAVTPGPVEERRSEAAADPGVLGRIEIPRLGVAAIVRTGADESTLARAVGLVDGASRPGEPGNIVLAGHRDTFFRPLRKIRVNDLIRLVAADGTHEYRVDSLRVVDPEDTSVLQSAGVEQLTLITCYPFRFIGPAPERFVVSATPVSR